MSGRMYWETGYPAEDSLSMLRHTKLSEVQEELTAGQSTS